MDMVERICHKSMSGAGNEQDEEFISGMLGQLLFSLGGIRIVMGFGWTEDLVPHDCTFDIKIIMVWGIKPVIWIKNRN